MLDLRTLFAKLGLADAKTLLQSGNVVFTSDKRSDATLEKLLELETEKQLKVATSYFVRTAKELEAIVAANPLAREAKKAPGFLHVVFLKDAPTAKDVAAVRTANKGPEIIHAIGRQAYVYYPDGAGQSKLRLRWNGTGRNWNTVLKLLALLEG